MPLLESPVCRILSPLGLSGQECLHTEATAARFFELGGFDDHGVQSLLMKNRFQRRCDAGSDIAAVDDDPIAHEAMGLIGGEQVNPLPEFMKRGKSLTGIRPRKNQCRFIVERAEASVEVVAIRIV